MRYFKAVLANFMRFVKSVGFILIFLLKWRYQKPCFLRTLEIVYIETSSTMPASRANLLSVKGPIFDLILLICLTMLRSSLSESFFGLSFLSFRLLNGVLTGLFTCLNIVARLLPGVHFINSETGTPFSTYRNLI